MLAEPYILDYFGLDEKAGYSETAFEAASVSHPERFLLEPGEALLFEAHEQRYTCDELHYFMDRFFYLSLRC